MHVLWLRFTVVISDVLSLQVQAAAARAEGDEAQPLRRRAAKAAERHAAALQQHADAEAALSAQQTQQPHAAEQQRPASGHPAAPQRHAEVTSAGQGVAQSGTQQGRRAQLEQQNETQQQHVQLSQQPPHPTALTQQAEAALPECPPQAMDVDLPDAEAAQPAAPAAPEQQGVYASCGPPPQQAAISVPVQQGADIAGGPAALNGNIQAPGSGQQAGAVPGLAHPRQPERHPAAGCDGSGPAASIPPVNTAAAAATAAGDGVPGRKPPGAGRRGAIGRKQAGAAAAVPSAKDFQPGDLIWAQVWNHTILRSP